LNRSALQIGIYLLIVYRNLTHSLTEQSKSLENEEVLYGKPGHDWIRLSSDLINILLNMVAVLILCGSYFPDNVPFINNPERYDKKRERCCSRVARDRFSSRIDGEPRYCVAFWQRSVLKKIFPRIEKRATFHIMKKGYSPISATNFLLFMDAPLAPALLPLGTGAYVIHLNYRYT
jgi:hypothetical protein